MQMIVLVIWPCTAIDMWWGPFQIETTRQLKLNINSLSLPQLTSDPPSSVWCRLYRHRPHQFFSQAPLLLHQMQSPMICLLLLLCVVGFAQNSPSRFTQNLPSIFTQNPPPRFTQNPWSKLEQNPPPRLTHNPPSRFKRYLPPTFTQNPSSRFTRNPTPRFFQIHTEYYVKIHAECLRL